MEQGTHELALFSRTLGMEWVLHALAATGTASVRKRKLPAEFVFWLVIGMALLRDRSIDEVVEHLDLVLPGPKRKREVSRKHPELPAFISARAIGYQRKGFPPQVVLASLLAPDAYPAHEIVELYHERWELEIGFDEVKTHTLERLESLRSKTPERVLQELWGLGIAYNLVRLEMLHVANQLDLPPSRISFRHSLMLIRNFLVSAWIATPGVLPKRLEMRHQKISLLVLPERRPRRYAREVKIKKTPPHRGPLPRQP
jgi:hypothetical protein